MNKGGDLGSASVELVLLTPVMMLFVVLAAASGRDADTAALARLAADRGARSASMVRLAAMESTARAGVHDVISNHPGSCAGVTVAVQVVSVHIVSSVVTRQVVVDVVCPTRWGRVAARSVEVVDRYRGES